MKYELGVAITPKNFPFHSLNDIDVAFNLAKEIGSQAIFIYQWHEFNLMIAKQMIKKSVNIGLTPIIGISPTTLDKERKKLDIPKEIRRKTGKNISFKNKFIGNAFKKSVLEIVKLKPPYLCSISTDGILYRSRCCRPDRGRYHFREADGGGYSN